MKPHLNVGVIGHADHSASLAKSLARLSSASQIVDVTTPPEPQCFTIPLPNLTKKQLREARRNNPVPVIPWVDYGNPRQG